MRIGVYFCLAVCALARGCMCLCVCARAWLGLDTVEAAELHGAEGPLRERACLALHGWLIMEPSNAAPASFYSSVDAITREKFPSIYHPAVVSIRGSPAYALLLACATSWPQVSVYAANLYDAITLYALAVAEAINKSIPISSPNILDILKQYVNRQRAMRRGRHC